MFYTRMENELNSDEIIAFLSMLENTLVTIHRQDEEIDHDEENSRVDTLMHLCEDMMEELVYAGELLPFGSGDIILEVVCEVYKYLEEKRNRSERVRARGRPCLDIASNQLEELLSFHFRVCDIARILQVSESTIK